MYIPLKPLVSFNICFLIFSESRFSKIYTGISTKSLIIEFNLSEQENSILFEQGIELNFLLLYWLIIKFIILRIFHIIYWVC